MIKLYFILIFILTVTSCQHKELETKEIEVPSDTSPSDNSIVADTILLKD